MASALSTSVAMCTFNGERFLREQLESIARQSELPSELVVHDDASTDASVAIVREFAASAPFPVTVRVNEQRIGSTANFSNAIAACNGEVIFLVDQDDVWRSDKVRTMSRIFGEEESVACVFSDARIFSDDGRLHGSLWRQRAFGSREQEIFREGRAFELLVVRNVVTGATMAFRSRYRDLLLPIPDAHEMVHDRWIALVLAGVAPLRFVEQPLVDYRVHPGQQVGPGPLAGSLATRLQDMRETGPAHFRSWAGQLRLVRDRLAGHGIATGIALDEKIVHLDTRTSMPGVFHRRLPAVTRELASGRYHRFSNGLLSAAKDLFRAYDE